MRSCQKLFFVSEATISVCRFCNSFYITYLSCLYTFLPPIHPVDTYWRLRLAISLSLLKSITSTHFLQIFLLSSFFRSPSKLQSCQAINARLPQCLPRVRSLSRRPLLTMLRIPARTKAETGWKDWATGRWCVRRSGSGGDCSGARGRERTLAAVGVWLQPPTTPRPPRNPLRNGGPSWGNPSTLFFFCS